MSKKMPTKRAIKIADAALRLGLDGAARQFGMTKQRVQQIFSCHKSRVLFTHELIDNEGNERKFSELRKIRNSFSL
jgi:hypothetical protein